MSAQQFNFIVTFKGEMTVVAPDVEAAEEYAYAELETFDLVELTSITCDGSVKDAMNED